VKFELFTNATPQKIPLQLLYAIGNTDQEGKKRHEVCRLDKVLLIKVTLSPFNKHILFHPTSQTVFYLLMLSQIDLAWNLTWSCLFQYPTCITHLVPHISSYYQGTRWLITEFRICLSSMKAFWGLETIFSITNFNLLARTLATTLYAPPIKLTGRKSLMLTAPDFFGIRAMKVALRLLVK